MRFQIDICYACGKRLRRSPYSAKARLYAQPDLDISRQKAAQSGTNAPAEDGSHVVAHQSIGREFAQSEATCHREATGCLTRIDSTSRNSSENPLPAVVA